MASKVGYIQLVYIVLTYDVHWIRVKTFKIGQCLSQFKYETAVARQWLKNKSTTYIQLRTWLVG